MQSGGRFNNLPGQKCSFTSSTKFQLYENTINLVKKIIGKAGAGFLVSALRADPDGRSVKVENSFGIQYLFEAKTFEWQLKLYL